ncbi:hypothetical protein SAMN04487928_11936 [Butyrivibrio proteoclasticus]|uniref:Glycosyl transferase GT2 family n=2 Tax=Butyrivibrio proteoclasticus TaxID=43305 RepID=A0A1I5VVI0_9FIRM|nr:hypothetical protein SAMN04487928_11936 [Butyrivibrio proteoclasticus]
MICFLQMLDYFLYKLCRKYFKYSYDRYSACLLKFVKIWIGITRNISWGKKGNNPLKKRLIVSMTTIPERIDTVHWSIESLLRQRIKPDKIIIYISEKEFDGVRIPDEIKEREEVEIKYVDNLLSHKKYYYTMRDYPEDFTITVDDDIIYSEQLIGNLLDAYQKNVNSIICSRSNIIRRFNGIPVKYARWKGFEEYGINFQPHPSNVFFTTGGGTLIPNWLMPRETLNIDSFMNICPTADDVWLNYMARLGGVKIVNTCSYDCHCLFEINNDGKNLSDINIYDGVNDKCIKEMARVYRINL